MHFFRTLTLSLIMQLSLFVYAQQPTTGTRSNRGSYEPGQTDVVTTSPASATKPPQAWTHPEVEERGVWVASQDLLATRSTLLAKLDAVTSANFTTVMLDAWFRGYVSYPASNVAPQYPQFNGDDVLGIAVKEAHKRGLRAEMWISYGFYSYHTKDATADPSMGPVLDKHPELAAVDSNGRKFLHNKSLGDFYSLCPSNPKSHELLGQIMVEAITKYPADGLHLDRIRYPDENYCYCPYCRENFAKDTGSELAGEHSAPASGEKFLQWKREQTAKAVAHFQKVARAARPGIPITSYVVGPAEMDSRAQGWDLWIKRGLLDAVAVSMYGADIHQPTRRAVELVGGDPAKLIQAISCAQPNQVYVNNIEQCRTYKTLGQSTWYIGDIVDDIRALQSGPYSKPAKSPFK